MCVCGGVCGCGCVYGCVCARMCVCVMHVCVRDWDRYVTM